MGTLIKRTKEIIKDIRPVYEGINLLRSRESRVRFTLRRLVSYPQKHVNYLINNSVLYGYGRVYPRKISVNLENPTLFNEKLHKIHL